MAIDNINTTDNLNAGRVKLNEAIDQANTVQDQLDTIVIASGTSDAETIQARGGEALLYNRLDKVDTQLAQIPQQINDAVEPKAGKVYVDQQIANVASGSPKGSYETLTDLETAFPTGTTGIYVVTADGEWYYWNDPSWVSGGVYQTTQWLNTTTTQNEVWSVI